MKAPFQLHQLSEGLSSLAALAICRALSLPAPQSLSEHPSPQRLGVDVHSVSLLQLLRHERRPEPLLRHPGISSSPNQTQHPAAKLLRLGAVRPVSRSPMLHPRCPFFLVALPCLLGLPIAHPHKLGRVHTALIPHSSLAPSLQRVALPPRSSAFSPSGPPLRRSSMGTFLSRSKGEIIIEVQHRSGRLWTRGAAPDRAALAQLFGLQHRGSGQVGLDQEECGV
jgi:hypothetical protein